MHCRLISTISSIPDQRIEEGQILNIGRNPVCKIKDLRCSRAFCKAFLKNDQLMVEYSSNKDKPRSVSMKSGSTLSGPGFVYRISIMKHNDDDANIEWADHDSGKVLVGSFLGGGNPSSKLAMFDFDFTLIRTKTGKAFPINENDWELMDPKLPDYMDRIVHQGYRFVIISNQMGISKGKTDPDMVKKRFNNCLKKINAPCLILIATGDDIYRKPNTGLWEYLLRKVQPETEVDMEKSFYVGDAAGRPKTATRKADFSASDLMFALNCGLNFLLPEKFYQHMSLNKIFNYKFDKNATSITIPEQCFRFKPDKHENFLLKNLITGAKITDIKSVLPKEPHCIIFCGISGSGKTTFYENYLKDLNYVHISTDVLKVKQKCLSMAKQSFAEKKNCVIDNTNVDKNSRSEWIELCKQFGYKPIIFHFDLPLKHIFHNNKYRQLSKKNKSVSDVVIYSQNKKFEPPSSKECSEQYLVNFVTKFENSDLKKLYSMYLSDK